MKTIQILLKIYLKVISLFSNQLAAEQAFEIFQKTFPKKISTAENKLYEEAYSFLLPTEVGNVRVYEFGDIEGDFVFFVHGWNSNAGSMFSLAQEYAKQGKYCILFDLPGHSKNQKHKTNLKECKIVFKHILLRFKSEQAISVVSHSFGSAVTAYALSESNVNIDKLVYLTAPNTLEELFQVLKDQLSLNDVIYQKVLQLAEDLLEESIEEITVLKKTKLLKFEALHLFHDTYDKVLPIKYSQLLQEHIENAKLHLFERIGHYRMLSNKELLRQLPAQTAQKKRSLDLEVAPSF